MLFRSILCFLSILLFSCGVQAETPYRAVQLAAAGVVVAEKAGADTSYYRYISLHNISPAERPTYQASLSYVLNSLNIRYEKLISYHTQPLLGGVVLEVNLDDLGINPKDFDKLVLDGSGNVPLAEPYFYLLVKSLDHYEEVEEEYGYWVGQDGQQCVKGTRGAVWKRTRVEKVKTLRRGKTELIPSPAITVPDNALAFATLSTLTHSTTPLVRADWFITYALWAPAYYQLLGVDPKGDLAQIDKIIGVDEALAQRTRKQAVADSRIVTLHNRILDRFTTVSTDTGGYYWQSFDTDQGIDNEEYINHFVDSFLVRAKGRALEREALKFKATETIWSNPNGLQGGALTDAKLKLLNVAVSNIALDKRSKFFDANVYTYRNCAICHDKQGGLWEIDDKIRRLATNRLVLKITEVLTSRGVDKKESKSVSKAVADAYGKDINLLIKRDVAYYSAAVLACTGKTPKDHAVAFEKQCWTYLEGEITPEIVAQEVGISVDRLQFILSTAQGLDSTLSSLLQDPPVPVSRVPFERAGMPQLLTLIAIHEQLILIVPILK